MKKNALSVKKITTSAIVTALYVALTFITYPISYGDSGIELRVAEILVLLCFFNADYVICMVVGCFIANLFGTIGIIDAIFGSFATLISCLMITKSKNIYLSSIYPIVFNAIIVGTELHFIFDLPLVISMISVAIGEFIVITLIGCPLFSLLKKKNGFLEMISATKII